MKLKTIILSLLFALLFAGALSAQPQQEQPPSDPTFGGGSPEPLGGCGPGEVFQADGGQYCEWLPVGQLSNPVWLFACFPTGACVSACYPYTCAASVHLRLAKPAQVSASASKLPTASRLPAAKPKEN